MKIVTYSDLRANMKSFMDEVCTDHKEIIVTRQDADPVVLISLSDYSGLIETLHLMQSRANAKRLLESKAQLEQAKEIM